MSGIVPPPTSASRAVPGRGCEPVVDAVPAHPGRRSRNVSVGNRPETIFRTLSNAVGGQVAVRVGAADQVEERRDVPAVHGHAGDDLLGQDVEAVGRDPERLDLAPEHRPRPARPISSRSPVVLAISRPLLDPADDVPRPADPLEPPRHAAGRLDLADQVDGPHVDPQLERGRRDHRLAARPASAPLRSSAAPPGSGCRDATGDQAGGLGGRVPAVGLGQLVEVGRQPLDDPAVVGEDDRRAMLARSARASRRSIAGQIEPGGRGPARSNGADDLQVELLPLAGIDDRHRPGLEPVRPVGRSTSASPPR